MPSRRITRTARSEIRPTPFRLLQALWALDHALNVSSRNMVQRLGVTGPQRLAIRLLGSSPGTTPGDLARTLKLHPGTVTGILRRLEVRGVVQRAADPRDGRRVLFRLTRAGQSLDAPDPSTIEAAVERVVRRFPGRELAVARRVLVALEEELGRR